jgi:hypothetical protein
MVTVNEARERSSWVALAAADAIHCENSYPEDEKKE